MTIKMVISFSKNWWMVGTSNWSICSFFFGNNLHCHIFAHQIAIKKAQQKRKVNLLPLRPKTFTAPLAARMQTLHSISSESPHIRATS